MTRHAPLRATWSEGESEALKPCPFCGGMAYRHELIEHYPASADGPAGSYSAWFHIGCNVCGIEVGDEYESSAIAAWNRRTALSLLCSELEAGGEPEPWVDGNGVVRSGVLPDASGGVAVPRAVNPPEFQEATWGVDSVMRPCKSMAISEYAFRQWAKDVGIVLADGAKETDRD